MGRVNGSALQGRKILVTGGCGFIGSALVRHLVRDCKVRVLNVDKLTYAGTTASVTSVSKLPNYEFAQIDICDAAALNETLQRFQPDAIVHLAAESHVDRSIDGPAQFVQTNIIGTYALLEAALRYHRTLPTPKQEAFRFLHVSTDEVYGALDPQDPPFSETSQYRPNSPYSASKASSDHLARSWGKTYGLPVVISNCSNNYGPYQFPEKLIPTMILAAMHGNKLPVYGTGENVRDWLFVDDHVSALVCLLHSGRPGETYLIGGGAELRNIDLVHELCGVLDELCPHCEHGPHAQLISFVPDRPGHDLRYAIDNKKIQMELGWRPRESFNSGLRRTVQWYLHNEAWWRERLGDSEIGQRRGLKETAASSASGHAATPRARRG